ncbi:MAG TPA: ATP-binding protein [Candidatus Cloacimonadota bacterium]|nr:ATP-binding protein [Candidatus Cloacimonadota bacterium]
MNFINQQNVLSIILNLVSLLLIVGAYHLYRKSKVDHKRATEKDQFRYQIFENTCIPIIVMRTDNYQFLDCNQAAVDIYQFTTKSNVIGKTPLDVSSEYQYDGSLSSDKARFYINQAMEKGSVVFDWRHQRQSGEMWDGEVHLICFMIHQVQYLQFSIIDITEKRKAEFALQQSENLSKTVIENTSVGISVRSATGQLLLYNQAWRDMWEISDDKLEKDLLPREQLILDERDEYLSDHQRNVRKVYQQGGEYFVPELITDGRFRKTGKQRHISQHFSAILNGQGKVEKVVVISTDITESKQAEADKEKLKNQLYHAQKMESVGRLAGGVAHDFNNMLGVIIGYTDLALSASSENTALNNYLKEISSAAKRSANLTRQLLAFARKQTVRPIIMDLNESINQLKKMLGRMIGENITLLFLPADRPIFVEMDPSQLDQILANLCVNARDAIKNKGKIIIETGIETISEAECQKNINKIAGHFALISVQDNGSGMDEKTIENAFEPFYTTKDQGLGTGLGLATVYGIIKQNKGFIELNSELGQGTHFKIYIPVFEALNQLVEEAHADSVKMINEDKEQLKEGILLVEDEKSLLHMTREMLEMSGYQVYATDSSEEAVILAKQHQKSIKLLLTDVIMPKINGKELSNEILQICPNIKTLFMSGYTAHVIEHHGVLEKGVHFLQKPFSFDMINEKVRESIDS